MTSNENIDWAFLGYPEMEDVLEKLASEDELERDGAYDMLISRRLLYSTNKLTLYFVPYFINLLRNPNTKNKGDLIIPLTDWTSECKRPNATEFHSKILAEIEKGLDVYKSIIIDDDYDTQMVAKRLLDMLLDNWVFSWERKNE